MWQRGFGRTCLSVVAAVALPVALGGCTVLGGAPAPSGRVTGPTKPTSRPKPASSATPTHTPTAVLSFGPNGYGALKLGMTKAQARATGLVAGLRGKRGSCGAGTRDGRLVGADPKDEYDLDGKLFFSVNTGRLVIIGASPGLRTPEGIELGSSTARLKAAYPKWNGDKKDMFGVGYVPAPGSTTSFYRIAVIDGGVSELTLEAKNQDCAE